MATIPIRVATPDDVPAIVELMNLVDPPEERITLEEFRYGESVRDPRDAHNRLVAIDGRRLVAASGCGNSSQLPPHKFMHVIRVHPEYRRRGIGTELEARQQAFAQERGGTELSATIREDDAGSRAFLERHGFSEAYRRFESELDVTNFDWSRFPGWRERIEGQGLRLAAFSEFGDNDASRTRLFDLVKTVAQDIPYPDVQPNFTYEDMVKYFGAPGYRPDALFVAVDRDRWVGFSGIHCPEGRPGYTVLTGTLRDYRGRGIATALKLATIEFAQRHGIPALRTNNDTVNAAMLAVNDRLGYRRLAARVRFKRAL